MVFLCFLVVVVCFLALGAGAGVAVSAAVGAADFGMSAAIDAAAKPRVIKAVVIKVADFFMRSPKTVVEARAVRRIRRI